MRLAGAGRANQAEVGRFLDPGELREVADQRAFGAGLGGEVEVLKRFRGREAGSPDALSGAGRFTCEHFGLAERLEELLVGPALGACAFGGRGQALEDARRLQGPEQVRQLVALS